MGKPSSCVRKNCSLATVTWWLIAVFFLWAGVMAVSDANSQVYQVGYPNIHPRSAAPGGPGFILAVAGTNVFSYSIVHWNGSPKETVGFVSGYLEAQILASDIAEAGTAEVTVETPGLGFSPAAPFRIEAPPPYLSHVVPNAIPAESPGFVLMAIGTYSYTSTISPFTKNSVVQWNGSDRETVFVDAQHLQANILAGDLTSPGTALITVSEAGGLAPYAREFTIKEPVPTISLNIDGGGAAQHKTSGESEQTQTGYATVTTSGVVPDGTAVFSFKKENVTVSEVAVASSPPTFKARIFVEYRAGVPAIPGRAESGNIDINTGIAMVNYGETAANITYILRDLDGKDITVGHGNLPAGHHDARFINQVKDVAPDFELPADFQINTQFASLEIQGDQPLSVMALRGTNNQRNDFIMTTTPIADLFQTLGTGRIFFPQFADGGGNTTTLVLMNTSDEIETGSLEILKDNGAPMFVNRVGGSTNYSFRYFIPVGGVFRFQTDGAEPSTRTGWVRLLPDDSTSTPVGLGIFGYNPDKMLVSESGIPPATPKTSARVYVDLSGGHNTALALINPNDTAEAIHINVNAFHVDGITAAGTSPAPIQLGGFGHAAMFANQLVNELPPDFKGVLDLSSSEPFAVMTIRSLNNERNDFLMASFPIADPSQALLAPILFPHIAEGGGNAMEFIFLSSSGASTVSLGLSDNTGALFKLADRE
jgi:hypothetical protein